MDESVESGPMLARFDVGISPFWQEASEADRNAQLEWQGQLADRGDLSFGAEVFISRLAAVYPERLVLGDRTYVSAHAYLWGDVEVGADCTLNPFTEVRGKIRIGDGVRIGAHTSILGFNHSTDTDRPIFEQPLRYKGIAIGDDVWIGSHVVILDGVSVGSHSIIAAGAIVTKDVPEWSVVAGNPARRIRDRRLAKTEPSENALVAFATRAREEIPQILADSWSRGERMSFTDHADSEPTVRAWCDAVELASLAGGLSTLPISSDRVAAELRSRQDPETGLLAAWEGPPASPSRDGHAEVNYHVLCAGYALELLGERFEHPIKSVERLSSRELLDALDAQPWSTEGWRAGAWVDSLGTALLWNRAHGASGAQLETVFGWLTTRANPATGLWGMPDATSGLLEPVNGFYRLTRGTYSQYGVPLPYPERTIDSVLAHAADRRYFGPNLGTACNVLDVIHPLWLAGKQTAHRREEGEAWARSQLERVLRSWNAGAGLSFALSHGEGWERTPGLLGTEMWLSITWFLADHVGLSELLGYRPSGIHRPERGATLPVVGT